MHRAALVVAASACLSLASSLAAAKVRITVDLDAQTMHVAAKDQVFDWKVSSGKPGYETPAGTFGVLWMDKDHHSDEYEQAPMPDSIFFAPGYAIHGFGKSPWGHKASHGCIRLPVAKAAILFDLVKAEGAEVNITGSSPTVAPTITASRPRPRDVAGAADAGYDAPDQRGYSATPGYGDVPGAAPAPRGGLFGSFY